MLRAELAAKDERIDALLVQVGELTAQVQALVLKLGKDSSTSSKPPSSDGPGKRPRGGSSRPRSGCEQRRDDDTLTKDERYSRIRQYIEIVKKIWTTPRALRPRRRALPFPRLRQRCLPADARFAELPCPCNTGLLTGL